MKNLFIILFVLIGFVAKAQFPSQQNPTQFSTGWFKQGWPQADSGHILAVRPPNFTPRFAGTIILYQQGGVDSSVYYYNGGRWLKLSQFDSTSLSNRINLKQNQLSNAGVTGDSLYINNSIKRLQNDYGLTFSTNATKILMFIDTLGSNHVVTTSQLSDTAAAIRAAIGGGSGLTSVGLSMPSAFSVSGSPLTSNGTINVSGAGTTAQYIRGNGTLATTDTGMIPSFHLKVRSLFSGISPITFNSTTGIIGITNANTSGTKGAATFSAAFSDNGSGTIDLLDLVAAGSCTGCNLNIDAKGRITGYADGPSGATNNANIGAGFRWLNGITQELRTVANSPTITWDSVSTANTLTAKADTSILATQFDISQLSTTASNGLTKIANDIQLGGAFTKIDTLNTSTFHLFMTGAPVGNGVLNVLNTSSDYAATFESTAGNSLLVTASTGNYVADFRMLSSGTNDIENILKIRRESSGSPANGIGGAIDFVTESSAAITTSNSIISKWTNATTGSRTSQLELWGVNNTTTARKAALAGTGQWTWDGYPALTAQIDTTTYKPVAIDVSGNVVKMAGWAGSGSGSGVTTLAPIGNTPNINGGTISGVTLNFQPATRNIGGVLTKDTQSIGGDKYFYGYRTTFNGKSPRLNSQWFPTEFTPDSIYEANKYLGFGFIDIFPSGKYIIVHSNADNHLGQNSYIQKEMSNNQGRSWTTSTVLAAPGGGEFIGPGGGGVTPSGRAITFYSKFNNVGVPIDQYIIYSDDEGATWSTPLLISHGSWTTFSPYGPMCKIGNDTLMLSWYGYDGTNYASYVIKSADDGATWGTAIEVVNNTTDDFTESSFTYVGGNTIIGLLRSEVPNHEYGQYISTDNGNTWTDQGDVAWGVAATPAYTKSYMGQNGRREVAAYYRSGVLGAFQERAIYAYAEDLINDGTSGWDLNSEDTLANNLDGSGYIAAVHPYDNPYALSYYYDETISQEDATIKFVILPKNTGIPVKQKFNSDVILSDQAGNGVGTAGIDNTGKLSFVADGTSNQWIRSGSNVYRTGLVGIGAAPSTGYDFHINKTSGNGTQWIRSGTASGDLAYILMGEDDASNYVQFLKYTDVSSNDGLFNINNLGKKISLSTQFSGGFVENFSINSSGNLYSKSLDDATATDRMVTVNNGIFSYTTIPSASYWTASGSDITNINSGGVGVGTTSFPLGNKFAVKTTTTTQHAIAAFIQGNTQGLFIYNVGSTSGGIAPQHSSVISATYEGGSGQYGPLVLSTSDLSRLMVAINGNTLINSTTDNGIGKLQVNGKVTIATTDSSATPANTAWIDPNTKEVKIGPPPSATTTLYTGDGTLLGARIVSSGGNTVTFSGTNNSDTIMAIINNGTNGTGLYSIGSLFGVNAQSTNVGLNAFGTGTGALITGDNSEGAVIKSNSVRGLTVQTVPSSTNTIEEVLRVERGVNGSPGANGVGASIDIKLKLSNSGSVAVNQIISKLTNATAGAQTSKLYITGVTGGGSLDTLATFNGDAEFATFGKHVIKVTTSSAGTLTLGNAESYIFNGTTTTWTLPPVSGTTGTIYYLKNIGSGSITLNADSGNNEIYTSSAVNTTTITAGSAIILISNGTYWTVN